MTEISWWRETIRNNSPRHILRLAPQASLFTDASPLGWGAHIRLFDGSPEILLHGRWRKTRTSNARECCAVERALRRLRQLPEGRSVNSLIIRSDNTATCFNINRRNAGETLLPTLMSLLSYVDRVGIQIVAQHIPGKENEKADRLSRISPGGDYALRRETLQALLVEWGYKSARTCSPKRGTHTAPSSSPCARIAEQRGATPS